MSISDYNFVVPQNVNRIIEERGLKQNAVAGWAGYPAQQFNDMLNGRKIIKPCDLSRISAALGVDVSDLFAECKPGA